MVSEAAAETRVAASFKRGGEEEHEQGDGGRVMGGREGGSWERRSLVTSMYGRLSAARTIHDGGHFRTHYVLSESPQERELESTEHG